MNSQTIFPKASQARKKAITTIGKTETVRTREGMVVVVSQLDRPPTRARVFGVTLAKSR